MTMKILKGMEEIYMMNQKFKWSNRQLRRHVDVLNATVSPHLLLKNATYLNQSLRKWMTANIWIYEDRIVYVGDKMPDALHDCEVIDCDGKKVVPGYIEPHAHPVQLYNPYTFGKFAAYAGTTTLINDNLYFFLQLERQQAFSLLRELEKGPTSMYWWCRLDSQTEMENEELFFTNEEVQSWLEHEAVLQCGELTSWPRLLAGDDVILDRIQETKRLRKKVEAHLPGASEKTLATLMLLGADCDHEAMTGKEALARLMQGYTVSLRNSSIRPDLKTLLTELLELGVDYFDKLFFTTDGSHPYFYEKGFMDEMIQIALNAGISVIDAYNMATVNIARYYNLEHLHGNIATGRIANLNILENEMNPVPVSVIAKGKWVKRDENIIEDTSVVQWEDYGIESLSLKWDLSSDELQNTSPIGIQLINEVITKPYESKVSLMEEDLSFGHDECYLSLFDCHGTWKLNTVVKGFANRLCGLASSYSGTGDIILIGKRKQDMLLAFNRMKELGGGIVLTEENEVLFEMPLVLNGRMSRMEVKDLIKEEKRMRILLKERGYQYKEPSFTLSFLTATHLPFIRVTPQGLYDVMKREVIVPISKRDSSRPTHN